MAETTSTPAFTPFVGPLLELKQVPMGHATMLESILSTHVESVAEPVAGRVVVGAEAMGRSWLPSFGRKSMAVLLAILALAAILSARVGFGSGRMALLALDPTAKAVMETVVRGEQATQEAAVVPRGYLGGPIAPEARASMLNRSRSALAAVYFTPIVDQTMTAVSGSIDGAVASGPGNAISPYPVIVQGGGAKAVDFPSLVISGDAASVTAEIETWLTVSQVRGGIAHPARPRNVIVVEAKLVRKPDGSWIISRRDWTFAPGHTP